MYYNYSLVHHNSCFRFITKRKLRESESLVFSVYALCMLFVNIPFFFLIFNFFGLHILFILCVLKRMEFCSFLRVGIRRFLISIIDCILPDVDLNASSVQIFLISITLECRTSGGAEEAAAASSGGFLENGCPIKRSGWGLVWGLG